MRSDRGPWRSIGGVALILLGLAALPLAARLGVDNRLERWTSSDRAAAERYAEFRRLFGTDEFLMVAVSGRDPLEPAALDLLVATVNRLEEVDGVERVEGLPRVYRDVFGAEDPAALRDEATSTPFYQGLFVSPDQSMLGLLVSVAPQDDPEARRGIVAGAEAAVAPLADAGFEVRLVGSPALSAELDEVSRSEALRTFPIAFMCSMLVLGWLLRSLRATAIAALAAGLSVVLTLGLMALAGRSLSMVTTALPPLLWVLSLSNGIHILQRYQLHLASGLDARPALGRALAEMVRPCTMAALTTALGFGSLVTARMPTVREVGLFAAAGILISLAVNLLVVPTLIGWWRVPRRPVRTAGAPGLRPPRRPKVVLAGWAVAAAAAACAIPWVRVESNPLDFLPAASGLVEDYREVGERLTGFYTMEVVIRTPEVWWDPAVAERLDRLAAAIEARPEVSRVVTPLDLLRKAHQWDAGFDAEAYRLPASRDEAAALIERMGDDGRQALARFAEPGGRTVRLSAVINEMKEERFLDAVRDTEQRVDALPEPYEGWITGLVLRLVEAQQRLVASQLRSLVVAFLVVFAAIAVGLRSWRLTAVAVPPNVVPLLAVFAAMAVFSLPLDAATVMVASVALGIAVDNTVHVLAAYQREHAAGETASVTLVRVLPRVVPALLVTTATAAIGFASLGLSAFIPIRDFGLLAGGALVIALLATLHMVPALLRVVEGT